MTFLYVVALVAPALTLVHLDPAIGASSRLIAMCVICGPFLTFFFLPYQRITATNLEHVEREIDSRAEDPALTRQIIQGEIALRQRKRVLFCAARGALDGPPPQRFLRVLNAHTRNQNLISSLVVMLSLIGFLVLQASKASIFLPYLRRSANRAQRASR